MQAFLACRNVLKLTYSNLQFQKFSGGETPDPAPNGQGGASNGEGKGKPRLMLIQVNHWQLVSERRKSIKMLA